jgi:1,4-dihydroxy-2-naphthoate octaprenyltransferase
VAGAIGVRLVAVGGLPILVIGVLSLILAIAYTGGPWPLAHHGLGDLFVFLFFGVIAVNGTVWLQGVAPSLLSLAASLPVACLVTAILVVNNLRDIPTDTEAGKRTLAVRWGDRRTRIFYVTLLVDVFLLVAVIGITARLPALIALLGVIVAVEPVRAVRSGATGPSLIPVLGATGRVQLVTGLLLALGLALGG